MRVSATKPVTLSSTVRQPAKEIISCNRQELSRDDIQELHSVYGIKIPTHNLSCRVIPPKQNSNNLTDQFLYCIKDCSLVLWDTELKFDLYFAKELLTQEDKLPKSLTQNIEQQLDDKQRVNNQIPAGHLKTNLERIIEHALNYEMVDEQTEAISAIYNAAQDGKKIVFVSAHGTGSEEGWGLDLYNVPYLIPTNQVLSELSSKHSNDAGLIYINSCNPENSPVDTEKVTLPVVAHTDNNGPSHSPVTLHTCI